jgi:hypothetical protein
MPIASTRSMARRATGLLGCASGARKRRNAGPRADDGDDVRRQARLAQLTEGRWWLATVIGGRVMEQGTGPLVRKLQSFGISRAALGPAASRA